MNRASLQQNRMIYRSLNIGAAAAGLAAVAVMAAVITGLILRTGRQLKTEYALAA